MKHLRGRTVFCNCDDPLASNFTLYFLANFRKLRLHRLISTGYSISDETKMLVGEENALCLNITDGCGFLKTDGTDFTVEEAKAFLRSNRNAFHSLPSDGKYRGGDFRSKPSLAFLRENPIVITNPPFSRAKAFISQLNAYHTDFLLVMDKNCVTYKEVFPYIQAGLYWSGTKSWNSGMWFETGHENDTDKVVNGIPMKNTSAIWLTNLEHEERHKPRKLAAEYFGSEQDYPKYDKVDAINVDSVEKIPYDYDGVMGCPITVLDNLCPEQFDIVWLDSLDIGEWTSHGPELNGKPLYRRVMIRNKRPGFHDWDHWV